jgi:hypothetical protein
MESRFGVLGTTMDGIFFTEVAIPNAAVKRHISVEISRQNSNLGEVKRRMATEARAVGASAVMNFRYGQKAHPWWELILTLKWDTESWHGEGDAVLA